MTPEEFEKTTTPVKTGFAAIRTKFHLDEVVSDIIEVVSNFHHHVGHFLEAATKQIPLINLLIDGIGKMSAIFDFRKKKSSFDKHALGIKVTAGMITTAVSITAFVLPHFSVPLILAGSSINLAHSVFSIYKTHRRTKQLEKELEQTPLTNDYDRQDIKARIDALKEGIQSHQEQLPHKTIGTLTSTVLLIGFIVMVANPLTVAPVSVLLATTAVVYSAYHFRKPVISALSTLSHGVKQLFGFKPNPTHTNHTPPKQASSIANTATTRELNQIAISAQVKPSPTQCATPTHFLQQQAALLSLATQKTHDTFQAHHTETSDQYDAKPTAHNNENTFLTHEDHALADILHPKPNTPTIKVTDADQDDDDGGEGGHIESAAQSIRETTPEIQP